MKHGSSTLLQSQIGSQLSGQQQMKAVQSDQSYKHQQARCWPLHFGMRKQGILFIDYPGKGRAINCEYYIALLVHLREEIAKKRLQMKKKKVLLHQDTVSQVVRNDGKTT